MFEQLSKIPTIITAIIFTLKVSWMILYPRLLSRNLRTSFSLDVITLRTSGEFVLQLILSTLSPFICLISVYE